MSDLHEPSSSPAPHDHWFTAWRFAGILAVFCVVVFWKILFAGEAMFYRDYGFLGYPFIYFHHESFWHGELPFWNPYVNCGAPFLAQWNTLTLYPGSLIYLLLPLPWSLGFFCVAHVFLAGMGMYFLAHRWTSDRLAGAVAGTAFAFSGLMLASLIYPNYMVTLGWMPWVVLCVERGWREDGRWLVLGALTGALQMLTGAPEILLLTWLFLAVMALGEAWTTKNIPTGKIIGRFIAIVALISGLTAVQLLPFFDLLAHSQRSSGFAGTFWSMPAWGWANLIAPMFHYAKTPQGTFVQAGQTFFPSYYLGIVPLFLAVLAVGLTRGRRVWLLLGAVFFSLCVALGDNGPFYGIVRKIVPVIGFARYPIKFVALAAFALPLLAAIGIARWQETLRENPPHAIRTRRLTSLIFLGVVGFVFWRGYANPLRTDDVAAFIASTSVRVLMLAGLTAYFRIFHLPGTRSPKPWLGPALVLLVFLDGFTAMPRQVPTITSQAFEPGIVAGDLKLSPTPKLGEARVMLSSQAEFALHKQMLPDFLTDFLVERKALWYNLNILDGIPKVNGASTLQPREQLEVENLIYGNTNDLPRLADFLGAAHVTIPGETTKWQPRTTYLPWITAGQTPVFVNAAETLSGLASPNFEPSRIVYLPLETRSQVSVTNSSNARVTGVNYRANEIEFEAEAAQPALVVIAQSFYHPWQATVDGKAVVLLRANHGFQALEVPAGKSKVKLVYRDKRFQVGGVITLITGMICVGLWWRARKSIFSADILTP